MLSYLHELNTALGCRDLFSNVVFHDLKRAQAPISDHLLVPNDVCSLSACFCVSRPKPLVGLEMISTSVTYRYPIVP